MKVGQSPTIWVRRDGVDSSFSSWWADRFPHNNLSISGFSPFLAQDGH